MANDQKDVSGRTPAAVHSVHEFVCSVPDLGVAQHFCTSFGLDVRQEDGALDLSFASRKSTWSPAAPGVHLRVAQAEYQP